MLCYTILYYAMSYAMLCYIIAYHIILYYIILYYMLSYQAWPGDASATPRALAGGKTGVYVYDVYYGTRVAA